MKQLFRTVLFLHLFIIILSVVSRAQKLTGIWRGYFITESGEEYRLEFQVQQLKTAAVTGVSYSYLDKRFYGKATMIGNFAVKNNSFQIQETVTTEVRNLEGNSTCLMNYKFAYAKSGNEEFLEGTYVGKSEDRLNPKNNGVWGDCGGGKVYLRRVENSEFYVEPFLREKLTPKKTVPLIAKTPVKKVTPAKPPVAKSVTAPKKDIPIAKATTKPPLKKVGAVSKEKTTTIQTLPLPQTDQTTKVVIPKKINLPLQTRSRQNELVKTLEVNNQEITIKIYDNGEIDDDTISVYLDEKLVLSQKRLTASPVVMTVKLDEENAEHVLVLVAENLGRIPPNTSLLTINDGEKRHELRITASEQKNAMVRFRYKRATP